MASASLLNTAHALITELYSWLRARLSPPDQEWTYCLPSNAISSKNLSHRQVNCGDTREEY